MAPYPMLRGTLRFRPSGQALRSGGAVSVSEWNEGTVTAPHPDKRSLSSFVSGAFRNQIIL